MSYSYKETLAPAAKQRYGVKLAAIGLEKCPFQLPADQWSTDMDQWPDVEYADIFNYLTTTAGKFR